MSTSLIGARVARKEDYRFLTGTGQYTDDVTLHGQTYAVFLRSTYAHARIRSIDTTAARQASLLRSRGAMSATKAAGATTSRPRTVGSDSRCAPSAPTSVVMTGARSTAGTTTLLVWCRLPRLSLTVMSKTRVPALGTGLASVLEWELALALALALESG